MKNIYLCGPTVYSEVHIGNMRPILTFDIYNRSLKYLGEDVFFIHNITDIDDKIITKAINLNISESEVSSKYTKLYIDLLDEFNVVKPNKMPLVTESIEGLVSFIKKLVDAGAAYEVDGNVYFDVQNAKGYGSLSNRTLNTMKFEEQGVKKHPGDFAVWKKTNVGVTYSSPWGEGRPGWHTECSYFVNEYLDGKSLDVHGGGIDLLFPHHENEDIQYKAINNVPIAKEWKHVGHLMLDNQKMSKSLGNVFDAKTFATEYGVDTLRYMFLTSSYSSPMNMTDETISQAKNAVEKLQLLFNKAKIVKQGVVKKELIKEIATDFSKWETSKAVKKMYEIIKTFNEDASSDNAMNVIEVLKLIGFSFTDTNVSDESKELIKRWEKLKEEKNYEEADKLRTELQLKKLI